MAVSDGPDDQLQNTQSIKQECHMAIVNSIDEVREHVRALLDSFKNDPPDNQYQKGFKDALVMMGEDLEIDGMRPGKSMRTGTSRKKV